MPEMNPRAPMVAGVAFAVLYAAAVLLLPALGGPDSGVPRVRALFLAFAGLALVFVLAFTRDRLTGPPAHLFTLGSVLLVAQLAAAVWFVAGPALRPGPATSADRALGDVAAFWLPTATIANICVAVPVLLAANEDRFPRWLGVGAAVFTVEQLLETITIIGPAGSFISPGGPMNHFFGGTLSCAFFLALGVATTLPVRTTPPGPEAPPPDEAEPADAEAPADDHGGLR
jgi:hypothetical protein